MQCNPDCILEQPQATAEQPQAPANPKERTVNTTQSLAQQFAAEYAKGVVPAMLKAIGAAKRDTRLIVAAVLAITYPHQALWLTTIYGIGILGWAIPAVVDLAMLRMLGIVQTVGMNRGAKKAALSMTAVLALMSGTVNISVPGEWAARIIFAALVLIAAGVKIVTALVGPDFTAMEQAEQSIAPAAPVVDDETKARRSAAAQKAAATRKANAEAAAAKAKRRPRKPVSAPVSPGIDGVYDPALGYAPANA